MEDAVYYPWMKDCHTPRFLQDSTTQCCSEVMVKLLFAASILMDNATYHAWIKESHTARFLQDGTTQFFSEVMVQAVACGTNYDGQRSIPSLRSWRDWLPFGFASPGYRYICDSTSFAMLGKGPCGASGFSP